MNELHPVKHFAQFVVNLTKLQQNRWSRLKCAETLKSSKFSPNIFWKLYKQKTNLQKVAFFQPFLILSSSFEWNSFHINLKMLQYFCNEFCNCVLYWIEDVEIIHFYTSNLGRSWRAVILIKLWVRNDTCTGGRTFMRGVNGIRISYLIQNCFKLMQNMSKRRKKFRKCSEIWPNLHEPYLQRFVNACSAE